MKDVVIKDIDRKTNLDKTILREAAILAYTTLAKKQTSNSDTVNRVIGSKRQSRLSNSTKKDGR